MTNETNYSGINMRWLDFRESGDSILSLRKQVFVEEQGFEDFIISSKRDSEGLHIGLFHEDRLFSTVSAYIIFPDDPVVRDWPILPLTDETPCIQISKRLMLPEYRRMKLNELLITHHWTETEQTLHPAYYFLTMYGVHHKWIKYYGSWGFEIHRSIQDEHGLMTIMIMRGEERLDFIYQRAMEVKQNLAAFNQVELPPLATHLRRMDNLKEKLSGIYLTPDYSKIFG